MNKRSITLFLFFAFATIVNAMERQEQELTSIEIHEKKLSAALKELPQDIGTHLVCLQLQDIHNQVNTLEEARNYLVSVSLVNTYCNQLANNSHVIKNIISNLSTTLCGGPFYEEGIAERLKTPATTEYIKINNQFFADNLKKNDIELLLQQGADPNYRRYLNDIKDKYDARTLYGLRHGWSRSPLIFYMLEETDDNIEIVKCLLDHGANIFIENTLYLAIDRNLAQIIRLFLSYNPIFSPTDTWGYLDRAIAIGNPDIIDLVMKAPIPLCNFKYALLRAVGKQDPELIQKLFDHGATPDSQLQYVVTQTLSGPAWPGMRGTLSSTGILQLFIKKGIQDQSLHAQLLAQAQATKQRAEEVIALLSGETEYDDVPPDLVPADYNDQPLE